MTYFIPHVIIGTRRTIDNMEILLEDLGNELRNIYYLQMALDNALLYCIDKRLDIDHLYVLSGYICKRLNKFVTNYERAEHEYYMKHVFPLGN